MNTYECALEAQFYDEDGWHPAWIKVEVSSDFPFAVASMNVEIPDDELGAGYFAVQYHLLIGPPNKDSGLPIALWVWIPDVGFDLLESMDAYDMELLSSGVAPGDALNDALYYGDAQSVAEVLIEADGGPLGTRPIEQET